MSHGTVDFTRDNIDVAIRLSTIDPPPEAIRSDVVPEWIGPVCSAEYLQTLRLTSVADLSRARLMVSRTRPDAWRDWSSSFGQNPVELVRDDLDSGALVAPLGFAEGPNRLMIWVAPHLGRRADTVQAVDC